MKFTNGKILINQPKENIMSIFAGSFGSTDDVFYQFEVEVNDQEGIEIIYANYNNEGYEGDAFVLFRRGGKLFESNGEHCSCYGLEGQWSPEETSLEALRLRDHYAVDYDAVEAALKDNMLTL